MTRRTLETDLRALTDLELLSRTERLARVERAATIRLLHHLNEIARRKLYLELGCSSLYDYCVRRLRYSGSSACRRLRAARCIREHPDVLVLLESGELDLGTVHLIEPVLSGENAAALLARVQGKSYRDVKRVVAEYGPPVIVEERIEPVQALVSPANIDGVLFERDCACRGPYPRTPGEGSWVVSEQKMAVQFLASEDLMVKYEAVKAVLSHSRPDATFADVLEVLLGEFLERHRPEARQRRREARRAAAEQSTSAGGKFSTAGAGGDRTQSPRRTRHVPGDVRDEVFIRDGARCAFVAGDGTRCGSRTAVQVDHIRPFAAGGAHDASNLRLLCPAHNRLAAEQTLGKHVMERYWRRE
ncbi:MAG TPA: HNH endonuclease signature motif containing protein [Candidatus Krumholzibacteria bacterium]|nr:HNH endonuclease signature motif containing protein [Candidatus Krumholzibacteria bacterium]